MPLFVKNAERYIFVFHTASFFVIHFPVSYVRLFVATQAHTWVAFYF